MRRILYYLLSIASGIATHVYAGKKVKVESSTLDDVLFVDGFDESSVVPDTTVWKLCAYAHNAWSRHFGAVDGYENVRMGNGYLKLRTCKDSGVYKSGGMFSKIGFPCDTRLEVKTRLTGLVRGGFPATWQMPIGAPEWPRGKEIDLVKWIRGTPIQIYQTVHTRYINGESGSTGVANKDPDRNFGVIEDHIYAVERTEKELVFYVDGKETWRYENQYLDKEKLQYPFCEYTFNIILNFSLGDDLDGRVARPGGIHDKDLPGEMWADWVRVMSLNNNKQPDTTNQ